MQLLHLERSKLDKLRLYGLDFDGNQRTIPNDFICEIPCSLKRTEIGPKVHFGAFSYMVSGYIFATEVGRYCSFGEEVQIGRQNHPIDWVSTSPQFYLPGNQIQFVSSRFENFMRDSYYKHGASPTKMQHTIIGHDVWIGHAAYLKAGIKVGNGSIIAAGSVVTKDVEKYTIVGGNPAKFIRYRIPEELIESLDATEWWNFSPKQLEIFEMHDIEKFIEQFKSKKIIQDEIKKIHLGNFDFS